jgi:5-methylcytosine-specific restriction endonuclease McrA
MVKKLTGFQKLALREMVEFKCQQCRKHEKEVGTVEPHRIKRGNAGGEYIPNNILMLCKNCHDEFHSGEFK